MMNIKSRFTDVLDRQRWAARRDSFMAKAKATKMVWFPTEPSKQGKSAAPTAKRATKRTTGKSGAATKKASRTTKKTATAR